ncbi:hypothetical protein EB796_018925 [Bugula neritina]|uniref:Uncharacterized protein n=1 Tax=Bugula neritina TaxID=10212 RepID=A0A7J7JAQ4_BUGNE|nr:hypothetical protein EB796_018925 [Bugula neritina]
MTVACLQVNPATALFSANCLAIVWFLQLRTWSYKAQGLHVCTNYTSTDELIRLDTSAMADWLDFCSCGHCNGAAEQFFVIMLLIGRYFLPKGVHFYHPENDKINLFLKSLGRTHFFLVIACNGADALDLISYSRFPTVRGNGYVTSMLLILFSASIVQFSIDTLATAEQKFSDFHIVLETDLWASLVILITCDAPFLAMRLFLMTKYQVFSSMGVFFFFKNFVFMCVTLHKGVMIWLGKDEDEIEEYVRSQPQSPDSIESMIDTPDSLNEMSDSESEYSHAAAVRSRAERNKKDEDWGDSVPELDRQRSEVTQAQNNSQFLGSSEWDVEAGLVDEPTLEQETLSIWNPKADPAYFTEGYADECDAMLDMSKVGNRSHIQIPLGETVMKGTINFSNAMPKPAPREIESAKSEKKSKKKDKGEDNSWEEEKPEEKSKPEKSKSESNQIDDDIADIINTVDEEPIKEKKKKKKKDKEKDQEEGDDEKPTKSEEKKQKKKKSKSNDLEPINEEEEEAERKEKHKKKKKNKDKDKD